MICETQDPAYSRLKDHLIATTGLAFYADRDKLLTDLIGERLSHLGLRDCASYATLLADGRRGSAEMEVLIAELTIGETYFFRDEEQFKAIRDVVLPDILEHKRFNRQLRIWSAGCATGAEPYSLAILLARELGDQIAGWNIRIHATDLNRKFLRLAAEGKFRARNFRATTDEIRRECFAKEGLTWTIHPRYKKWISFHYMNLMENEFSTSFPGSAGGFDLILCRNVMIYFSREVNRRLIGQFHQSLGDQGWLVVSSSEYNLDNFRAFHTVNTSGARLFKKGPLPPAPPGIAVEAPSAPALVQVPAAALPPPVIPIPAAPIPAQPDAADIEGLRQLANHGDWQGAADYGRRLLTQSAWSAEIHFYHALIFEKLGMVEEPERSLRHAIYLDRNFALAHYHLGLTLKREGHARAAARCFGNVLKVLTGLPDLAIVTAGPGVTVMGLKELAKMHLDGPSG